MYVYIYVSVCICVYMYIHVYVFIGPMGCAEGNFGFFRLLKKWFQVLWLRQVYPCYIHLLVPLPTLVPSPTTENQFFTLMFVLLSCSVFLVVVVVFLLVLCSRASNFGELSVSYFRLFGGVEFLCFFGVVFLCLCGVGFLCLFGVGFLASDFFCNWYVV